MTESILRVRELIEKLEAIEKEYGNIPVVVEDQFDPWETNYKNVWPWNVEVYDEMLNDKDQIHSAYSVEHYSMKPAVHIG